MEFHILFMTFMSEQIKKEYHFNGLEKKKKKKKNQEKLKGNLGKESNKEGISL